MSLHKAAKRARAGDARGRGVEFAEIGMYQDGTGHMYGGRLMVDITNSRPRDRSLQLGADLVHGIIQGTGQAAHGLASLGLAELGRGAEGGVQQDAGGHTHGHSAHKSAELHR